VMLVAFGISSFAAILFGGLAFSQNAFAGNGENNGQEVTICHVDQNTGEEKSISVGSPAVDKHLANHDGDHLGECTEITCQQCYDSLVVEFDVCQEDDYPCIQQAFEDFASCSLTCTGPLEDNFPQECVNSAATHLDTCLERSQSTDDVISCFDQGFYELLVACPAD